ncbi:hypothetical protein LCGC14_0319910 [marine sediment metagenome]|uniref:Uncharacterized protein n=1 Tax=marine sediment metagenome TaxID=412755 RepID=A0A0F9WRK0_9ZZZZ
MTLTEVQDRVEKIRELARMPLSPEAHIAEDELRGDVLRAIAVGHENPALIADEALKTSKLEFPRWYE